MLRFMKRTQTLLLAAALLLSGTVLVSCKNDDGKNADTNTGENTDTGNFAYDTLSPEEYALYSIADAQSAYPDMPAVITFVSKDGKEYPVTYDEFRYFQLSYKDYFDDGNETYWTTSPDMIERAKKLTVDEIMRNHAVLSECEKYGISLTEEEKEENDRATAELVAGFGSREIFDQALAVYYMTEYFYNYFQVEISALYNKLEAYYKESKMILTEDADIRAMLNTDDFIRAKHILILNDAGDDTEENRNKAEDLLGRLEAGEDFDTLMKEFSEDTGLEAYPDGYYFFRGEMDENFENAAFALAEGEMSDIVESAYGYHIILRCPKENTYMDENYNDIRQEYLSLRTYQLLEEACEGWEIRYCTDFDTLNDWEYAKTHGVSEGNAE